LCTHPIAAVSSERSQGLGATPRSRYRFIIKFNNFWTIEAALKPGQRCVRPAGLPERHRQKPLRRIFPATSEDSRVRGRLAANLQDWGLTWAHF
jgi:hypothetical protein